MKMPKKGQGMSMNVIIIAALALIVMVVLIVIFMGRMGGTRATLESCSSAGGNCVDAGSCLEINYQKEVKGACLQADQKTIDTGKVCCIRV
jgi:hypothetical protein